MKIEYVDIKSVKPYKNNAKKHTKKQVEMIAKSIKMFGFNQPVLIDKNNTVVVGHGRVLAAKKNKLNKIPVVRIENLTDEELNAYRLIDNKLNESAWDYQLLEEEIEKLQEAEINMKEFGFDNSLLSDDELIKQMEEEIKVAENEAQKKYFILIQLSNENDMLTAKKEIEQIGYICDTKIK